MLSIDGLLSESKHNRLGATHQVDDVYRQQSNWTDYSVPLHRIRSSTVSQSVGVNRLIQNGARPVMEVKDILEALNLFIVPQHLKMQAPLPDNDDERAFLKLISHEPCRIDELFREPGLATTVVSATLTMLELKGMVKQVGGMQFVLLTCKGMRLFGVVQPLETFCDVYYLNSFSVEARQ